MIPPTGRLRAKTRPFHEIVYDMRHVVFSVVRLRQQPQGTSGAAALGTGFFVSPEIFITCDHVMNNPLDPHQPGDSYALIANLTGTSGRMYTVTNPQIAAEINLFPNIDLAVLRVPPQQGQPYVQLEYGDVYEGEDIGVVGYPIPQLNVVNGNLAIDSLVYRSSRGHVTARYTIPADGNLANVPIVEPDYADTDLG